MPPPEIRDRHPITHQRCQRLASGRATNYTAETPAGMKVGGPLVTLFARYELSECFPQPARSLRRSVPLHILEAGSRQAPPVRTAGTRWPLPTIIFWIRRPPLNLTVIVLEIFISIPS
jgi:hypothetical protein